MPKKDMALGADFLEWYREWPLGNNWYLEPGEVAITDDDTGKEVLDPAAEYNLQDLGEVYWQGDGDCPGDKTLVAEFRKWKRAKEVERIVLTVPKAEVEAARALASEKGWL